MAKRLVGFKGPSIEKMTTLALNTPVLGNEPKRAGVAREATQGGPSNGGEGCSVHTLGTPRDKPIIVPITTGSPILEPETTIRSELTAVRLQIGALNKTVEATQLSQEESLKTLKEKFETLKLEYQSIENANRASEKVIDTLRSDCDRNKEAIHKNSETRMTTINELIKRGLQGKSVEIEAMLTDKRGEINELSIKLENLMKAVAEQNKAFESRISEKIEECNNCLINLEPSIEDKIELKITKLISSIRETIPKLESSLQGVRDQVTSNYLNVTKQLNELTTGAHETNSRFEKIESDLSSACTDLDATQQRVNTQESTIKTVSADLDATQQRVAAQESTINTVCTGLDATQQRIAAQESSIGGLSSSFKQLSQKNADENFAMQVLLDSQKKEVDKAELLALETGAKSTAIMVILQRDRGLSNEEILRSAHDADKIAMDMMQQIVEELDEEKRETYAAACAEDHENAFDTINAEARLHEGPLVSLAAEDAAASSLLEIG